MFFQSKNAEAVPGFSVLFLFSLENGAPGQSFVSMSELDMKPVFTA